MVQVAGSAGSVSGFEWPKVAASKANVSSRENIRDAFWEQIFIQSFQFREEAEKFEVFEGKSYNISVLYYPGGGAEKPEEILSFLR